MDRFEELTGKLSEASAELLKLATFAGVKGFREELRTVAERLRFCLDHPVTEEVLEQAITDCERTSRKLMATVDTPGGIA